ncbi:helicase-like transcription factor [Saccostrea echinata]|uniref:helicase-like transcription factor n=1 Tax=Saccostrea echinata TaxID=191078 RepID=UPI002A7EACE5|nr:helicase-like transcription factor [Saccostrea echinata]
MEAFEKAASNRKCVVSAIDTVSGDLSKEVKRTVLQQVSDNSSRTMGKQIGFQDPWGDTWAMNQGYFSAGQDEPLNLSAPRMENHFMLTETYRHGPLNSGPAEIPIYGVSNQEMNLNTETLYSIPLTVPDFNTDAIRALREISLTPLSSHHSDRITPTSSHHNDRITPPSSQHSDRITPTSSQHSYIITPPSSNHLDRITPPSSQHSDRITPPSSHHSDRITPLSSNHLDRMTPPSSYDRDRITPPKMICAFQPPKKRRRIHENDFNADVLPYINLDPDLPEDIKETHIPNQDFIRYCTARVVIVGLNNFRGQVESGEEVYIIKDGSSKTCMVATNRFGVEVGYLKSDVSGVISPLRDKKVIGIEGTAIHGSQDALLNSIAIYLKIFGKEGYKLPTLKKLIDIKVPLNIDICPSESQEDIMVALDINEKFEGIFFNENQFLNMKEEADAINTLFENLAEEDKMTPSEPSKEIVTPLHMHQKQALHWMIMKENGSQLPPFWDLKDGLYRNSITSIKQTTKPRSIRGGILADEMGLGKTLTVISLIVTNPKNAGKIPSKIENTANGVHTSSDTGNPESRKNMHCEPQEQVKDEDMLSDNEETVTNMEEISDNENPDENIDIHSDLDEQTIHRDLSSNVGFMNEEGDFNCDTEKTKKDGNMSTSENLKKDKQLASDNKGSLEDGNESTDTDEFQMILEETKDEDIPPENEEPGTDTKESSDVEKPNEHTDFHSDVEELTKIGDVGSDTDVINEKRELRCNAEKIEDGNMNSDSESLQKNKQSASDTGETLKDGIESTDTEGLNINLDNPCENIDPKDEDENSQLSLTNSTEKIEKKKHVKGTNLKKTKKKKKISKTTLIVAPVSVINVWETQIIEHVDKRYPLKTYTFHGRKRVEDESVLTQNDVVLTSYDTLRIDAKKGRILQEVKWFRVVLDEGHKIKNPSSKQTQAINSLQSQRRWILTGTPIQNKIEELWSLISFLKIDTFTDVNQWKKIIVDPLVFGDGDAKRRIFHLVNFIALRRTKTSTIRGEKILSLPQKTILVKEILFCDKEMEVYREFDRGCKQLIRRLIDERRHLQEIGLFYAALVRLRQLCCHPEIIPPKAKVGKVKLDRSLSELENTHTGTEKLASLLRLSENDCCSVCLEEICVTEGKNIPVITDCDHVFCKACIVGVIQQYGTCPNCRGNLSMNSLTECPPDELALRLQRPELDKSVLSTKTTALMIDLHKLRDDSPGEKCVIVSEFTTLLDVIEEPLKSSNFRFVRLDGKMNQKARAKSIEVFSNSGDDSPTVMLLSLKAGGEGISLVAASRVFLLTPHWNPATEEQCFDRCHRLGQTKDVIITKYVVKNTIEERILNLQEQKKKLMDCAFNNSKKKPEKLGINEIRTLLDV